MMCFRQRICYVTVGILQHSRGGRTRRYPRLSNGMSGVTASEGLVTHTRRPGPVRCFCASSCVKYLDTAPEPGYAGQMNCKLSKSATKTVVQGIIVHLLEPYTTPTKIACFRKQVKGDYGALDYESSRMKCYDKHDAALRRSLSMHLVIK